jgi:hypothetical protein
MVLRAGRVQNSVPVNGVMGKLPTSTLGLGEVTDNPTFQARCAIRASLESVSAPYITQVSGANEKEVAMVTFQIWLSLHSLETLH